VLNVILIPKMGIEGAAIGTTVSYSIAAGILFVAFVRESGLPWYSALVINREDVAMWGRLLQGARSAVQNKLKG
jgi:Na+-driven multidrug efflux pump